MAARTKARKRAVDVIYEADMRLLARTGNAIDGVLDGSPHSTADQVAAPTGARVYLDEILIEVLRERLVEPGTQTALPEYSAQIVQGLSSSLTRIDEELSTYSHGWTLARMPAVDRAILRVGAWELLFNEEVPDAVAVDEAVELALSLSTDESPSFINGLLGRLLQLKT